MIAQVYQLNDERGELYESEAENGDDEDDDYTQTAGSSYCIRSLRAPLQAASWAAIQALVTAEYKRQTRPRQVADTVETRHIAKSRSCAGSVMQFDPSSLMSWFFRTRVHT